METKKLYHAHIEIDLEINDNDTLSVGRRKLIEELKKTNIRHVFTHDDDIREAHCFTLQKGGAWK